MFCIRCGTELPDVAQFCKKCGHQVGQRLPTAPSAGTTPSTTISAAAVAPATISAVQPVSQPPTAPHDESIAAKLSPPLERYFLRTDDGVVVTNSRFIFPASRNLPGGTYAMANVASVKRKTNPVSRVGPVVLGVVGLLTLLPGSDWRPLGAVMVIAAVLWWILHKPTFTVILSSASGDQEALTSKDGEYIQKVINALNEAIIHRG